MIQCECGAKVDRERLPGGWKRHQDRVWCRDCWSQSWVLRAVSFPLAGPAEGDWPDLRSDLRECWSGATTIANWAVTEMAKADVVRTPDMGRLPAKPALYLYPGARSIAPDVPTGSVTAILHAVEGRYRKSRFGVLWLRNQSLPAYRYPVPFPVPAQRWSAAEDEGTPVVHVPLGSRRWALRLRTHRGKHRGGRAAGYYLGFFRKITSGVALPGELSIYEARASASERRTGGEGREPGGPNRAATRIMVKLVAWVPKVAIPDPSGTLYVRTAADSLMVYHVGVDGEPHFLRADHVRRWVREYQRKMDRRSDDLKHEKRWPKRVRRAMVQSQGAMVDRQRNRLDSFTHEATAMIAAFAARSKVAVVLYDDTDRSYVDRFPWEMMRNKLAYKLEGKGIAFEVARREGRDDREDA